MVKPRYIKHPYCIYVGNPNFSGAMEFGFGFTNNMGFSQTADVGEKIKTRVICIGGSTTELNDGPDVSNSYPGWLQRELGDNYEVINAGVCGYTSAEMLINFELRLLDLKPDYVVIYEAVNDVLYAGMIDGFKSDYTHSRVNISGEWKDVDLTECINKQDRMLAKEYPQEAVDTFKRNIKNICAIAICHGIKPIIVKFNYNPTLDKYDSDYIYPLPQLGLSGGEKLFVDGLRRNNAVLKEISNEVHGVFYVETEYMSGMKFIDNFHFNEEGMKIIAKAVSNAIKP